MEFFRPADEQGEDDGQPITVPATTLFSRWVEVKPLKMTERAENARTDAVIDHKIKIPADPETLTLKPTDFGIYNARRFEFVEILDELESRRELTALAKELAL